METSLASISLVELFETETRPVFAIDVTKSLDVVSVYRNPCLSGLNILENLLTTTGQHTRENQTTLSFLDWVLQDGVGVDKASRERWESGITWVKTTLRGCWRIIRGEFNSREQQVVEPPKITIDLPPSSPPTTDMFSHDIGEKSPSDTFRIVKGTVSGVFDLAGIDWEGSTIKNTPSDCGNWIRNFDWNASPLGPLHTWSVQLQQLVIHITSDPRPAALFWGPDRCMLYNEHYAPIAGRRHPAMMGKRFADAWPEVAEAFESIFERGERTGQASTMENAVFILERNGYTEEMFCTWSVIPLVGNTGEVIAFYNPVTETTRQTLSLRRMELLLGLSQHLATVTDLAGYWQQVRAGLEPGIYDVPCVLVFGPAEQHNEGSAFLMDDGIQPETWQLEGSMGYPEGYALPEYLDRDSPMDGVPSLLTLATHASGPTLLSLSDGSLPPSFMATCTSRGFGESCTMAILCPIRPMMGDKCLGFLVLGVNPRRPYDTDYQTFADLVVRQLSASMAAMLLAADQVRRTETRAALAKKQLSEQLAIRTNEVARSELKFRQMWDLAPVAMFNLDINGALIYANDLYYKMTGQDKSTASGVTWASEVDSQDLQLIEEQWIKLTKDAQPVSFEVRLRTEWRPPGAELVSSKRSTAERTWILSAAYPEFDANRNVIGVAGCFTDISHQKWAEGVQSRRTQEALELKKQQEMFIDMTSHELRNPLSAIVQCADSIISSFDRPEYSGAEDDMISITRGEISDCCSAANTILFCAQHQKRITDDVLMLSKLNSDLVKVTPVQVQPLVVIEDALRVFEREFAKSDINCQLSIGKSFDDLNVQTLTLDPSRLTQVVINLVGNALKFTQTQAIRNIDITANVTTVPHLPEHSHITFMPVQSESIDAVSGSEWQGEVIYLHFAVKDSGPGMTESEMLSLFQRFAQTSPRTHVDYGGSGLGLFISKRLTEVQGGTVGVASEAGVGSTFAFYVKARRCAKPQSGSVHLNTASQPPRLARRTSTFVASPLEHKTLDYPKDMGPLRVADLQTIKRKLSETPSSAPKSRKPAHGPSLHVLVVEDNLINQRVLAKQLRNLGYVVSVANHGGEALDHLKKTQYWGDQTQNTEEPLALSVVLMDLEMPVMDGLTCVKQIRRFELEGSVEGHIPVVAVTANARSEQIAIAKEAGMDGVVCKPFRIPELVKYVEELLQGLSVS